MTEGKKTDNELIAEFMGGVYFDLGMSNKGYKNLPIPAYRRIISETTYKYVDELNYHESWDSLMDVVDKIESLGNYNVDIQKLDCCIYEFDLKAWPDGKTICFSGRKASRIEAVHQAVVEFIKWYNQQSK
jgi:hypothetical protein